jgi:hypothetical protein
VEPRVTVNPHQRTARPSVDGREILRDLFQTRSKRPNEGQTRFQHFAFISRFVFRIKGNPQMYSS